MANDKSRAEIELHPVVYVVLAPFMFWGIFHAIQTRTAQDFVRYASYIALPLGGLLLIGLLIAWKDADFRRPSLEQVVILLFAPVGLFLAAAAYYALGAALKDASVWLKASSSSGALTVPGTILATLGAGLALFYFRLYLRSLYGLTEVMVGLAIAAMRVAGDTAPAFESPAYLLALLTAGVYLVVRGLDNIHQGIVKEPYDPIARGLIDYFKKMSKQATAGESVS
ncbi:MAG: hypothetical protein JWR16_2286 [Nevskia sp.]|nr:hypothetical protein [Nevskia sp.]